MNFPGLQHAAPLAINMNQPGSFVHWSIFTVSVANLVLIAVMVVIFGVALLLPFPRGVRVEPAAAADGARSRDGHDGAPSPPGERMQAQPLYSGNVDLQC